MKQLLLATTLILSLIFNGLFGQTTVCYDFSAIGASTAGVLDANISFTSQRNSSGTNPAIFSNQLRLYQNATKGGSILITALNGVTITDVVVNASGSTGPAGYEEDGVFGANFGASTTYTMSGLSATSDVEFYQRDGSSSNRIYINSFCVTYTTVPTCTAPTLQPTAVTFSSITDTDMTIDWVGGNGTNSLVVISEAAAVSATPSSVAYTANTTFASGDDLGGNNYVVYNGIGSSVTVTGLSPNTTYHVAIFEFNSLDNCHNTTSPATGSQITDCAATPDPVTGLGVTVGNAEATVTWTNPAACFDEILVIADDGTITHSPSGNGSAYTANSVYGSGSNHGGNEYAVYKGTGTTVNVTGLTNGDSYCFKVWVRYGTNWSVQAVNCSNVPTLVYCDPGTWSSSDSEIENVTLIGENNDITNNTTDVCTGAIQDYTAMSADLGQGSSYTLTVEFGDCNNSTQYNGGGGVWIDWNGDGDFDDLNEEIGTVTVAVSSGNVLENFTINVPVGQPVGNYRMRIVQDEGGTAANVDPCNDPDWGAIEDYTVEVIAVTACTPPTGQATIVSSAANITTANVTWARGIPGGNGVVVLVRPVSAPDAPVSGTTYTSSAAYGAGDLIGTDTYVVYNGTGTTVNITALSPSTTYEFAVYEYNTTGVCYLSPAATGTFTTTANCIATSGLASITCDDNITPLIGNDDLIKFDLDPTGPSLGAGYTVSVSGGGAVTITPTTATYGSPTSFELNTASAGFGDVTLIIQDNTNALCSFEVTITDPGSCSDPCSSFFSDDFSGTLGQWSNNTDWIATGEMEHNHPATNGSSYNVANVGLQDLTGGDYEWEVCLSNGNWDPSGSNTLGYWLLGTDSDLLAGGGSGYVVGVNYTSTSDDLTLYRVDGGVYTAIVTSPFSWNANDDVCIRVTRTSTGDWELLYNPNGTGEVSGGTVTDATHSSGQFTGPIFSFTSSRAGLFYIDDINICTSASACVATHTITGFAPTSGPALTIVTVSGTGFTAASTATIGGVTATTTFINATTLEVEIPAGASDNTIVISESGCTAATSSPFTVNGTSGTCGSLFSDIIISEVYDEASGSSGYIEVYNGTGAVVDLTTYSIDRYGDLTTTIIGHTYTFPAAGVGSTIAAGQVLVGRVSTTAGVYAADFVFGNTTSGFNDDDRLELMNGGTIVDDFHDAIVGSVGYVYRRNTTITGPNTVFTASEWTTAAATTTSGLGNYAYSTTSPPTVNTDPSDVFSCTIDMSVSATAGSGGTLTYQWLFNDGSAAGWTNVSAAAFPTLTVAGATTANLSISGAPADVAAYDTYQFYCRVTEDGTCNTASKAAQFYVRDIDDPRLITAMINSCNDCGTEGDNEYVIVSVGDAPVVANSSNIVLSYGTTYPAATTLTGTYVANTALVNALNAENTANGCASNIFVDAITTGTLPANAKVFIMDPNICTTVYNFSHLCSSGPLYLLFSTDASWGSTGNFSNTGGVRYFSLAITNTNGETVYSEYSYDTNLLTEDDDGDFAQFSYCEGPATDYRNDGCDIKSQTLPAELIQFDATPNGDVVNLDWTTATEINVYQHIVERSQHGVDFSEILYVNAAGNSSVNTYYHDIDYQPLDGISYYRLKTVDFDNTFKLSPIRTVKFENDAPEVFYGTNEWVISYDSDAAYDYVLYNVLGEIIINNTTVAGNETKTIINNQSLPNGVYFININSSNINKSIKVIK